MKSGDVTVSTPIKTNKLHVELNCEEIENRYDIFLISTSEKYFAHGAYIIDAPLLCNNVCAVSFESGRAFYVLMNKYPDNKSNLKKTLFSADGGDTITISTVTTGNIRHSTLLQLLLNALSGYSLDFMKFNNLTGHLYCFHPKWIKRGHSGQQSAIMKIPCLEIKISDDMKMLMNVHTFTSELLRHKIKFNKRKFEQYPKYVFSANNTLRRKLQNDSGPGFIMRQTAGAKTEIPFLDIGGKEKFDACKMGVVQEIFNIFNKKFFGLVRIEFANIEDYRSLDHCRAVVKEEQAVIKRLLAANPIKIVDKIDDEYSHIFCNEIKTKLAQQYGVQASVGKGFDNKALNVCVIHNAIYYDGIDDPHSDTVESCSVQHVTFEDFLGSADYALSTVIHELLIKNDIQVRQLTLFDWSRLGFKEKISFGVREVHDEDPHYFFMTIDPSGSFKMSEQRLNLFEMNEYSDCVNIFEDHPDVCGIVKTESGDINIISNTDWITIPEIDLIYKELRNGNTYLRGKEKRDELLSSILDIKLFKKDDEQYYFVGVIGEGMRAKIETAANIRRISAYKNAPLLFEKLLPLMNVTFVHNGQLTVVPFPFKYLREYVKANS